MKRIIIIALIMLSFDAVIDAQKADDLNDERDGKTYSTVIIGDQTWMAENLDFDAGEGSWAYGDDAENTKTYGRLYDWETANTACPAGWHLSTDTEWDVLVTSFGGPLSAGGKLKTKGTEHWLEPNIATNESGFSALPGGKYVHGDFMNINKIAAFWTETESTGDKAHCKGLRNKTETVKSSDGFSSEGRSVRCIKD
ncbi:MAG: hypothetical protein DRJ05_01515 [Bacteroidetes bacterium]|nr:MAG: hypothetical protein DRJ05_01515 [Bacteroidota bacterium]